MKRPDSISLICLKTRQAINFVTYVLAILCFITAFVSVMLQIIGRASSLFAISWTEELARFAFVGVALFGSVILVSNNEHLKVDLIQEVVPKKAHIYLQLLANLVAIVFCGAMLPLSWDTAIFNLHRLTAALRVSASVLYFALWAGCLLMLVQAALNIILLLRNRVSGESDPQ